MSQVKTGAICALAGIIGGGVLSYERENDESARFLKHMDEEIQVLRDRADVHGKYWDSLKNVIYKKDSLLKEYVIAYKAQRVKIQENEKTIELLNDAVKLKDREIEKYETKFGGRYTMEKDSHCCTSAFMVIPTVTTTLTVVTVIQVSRIVV